MTVLQYVQVVIPELILDEKSHYWPHQPQESYGIDWRVDRQIADDVGTFVVLAHFIARRREKGEQNLVFGMLASQAFHDRPSLLELSE